MVHSSRHKSQTLTSWGASCAFKHFQMQSIKHQMNNPTEGRFFQIFPTKCFRLLRGATTFHMFRFVISPRYESSMHTRLNQSKFCYSASLCIFLNHRHATTWTQTPNSRTSATVSERLPAGGYGFLFVLKEKTHSARMFSFTM